MAQPKPYDEAKVYDVKLARKVERHGMVYRPLNPYEMKGGFLNKLVAEHGESCIDRAEPR